MEKNKPMEEVVGTYETGVTQPGKSSRGVVAVLLMIMIFLSGVVSALGLMNIRLLGKLQTSDADQAEPVLFEASAEPDEVGYARMDVGTFVSGLDVWCVQVSGVCNEYYDIPQGPLVTSAGEDAKKAGICPGDILLQVDGQSTQTESDLQKVLEAYENGEQVVLRLYRVSDEKELEITMPVVK